MRVITISLIPSTCYDWRGSLAVGRAKHNSWKKKETVSPLQNKKLPSRYSISITSALCFPSLIIYYSTLHLSDEKNLRLDDFRGPLTQKSWRSSSSNGVKFRTQLGANTGCFRTQHCCGSSRVQTFHKKKVIEIQSTCENDGKRGFFDKTVLFCVVC